MKISDLKNYTVLPSTSSAPVKSSQTTQAPSEGVEVKKPKSFMDKVFGVAKGVSNFIGAKGITEQFGADIARATVPKEQKDLVQYPSFKSVVGSSLQSGSLLLPGVGAGANLGTKILTGAATGYGFDVGSGLQDDNRNVGQAFKPGVGAVVGGSLPLAGAVIRPVTKIIGRLLSGLGTGLSGVSSKAIDSIVSNPRAAQEASRRIAKTGNEKVLEDNARTIINGISTVRQQARKQFGEAMGSLKAEDINPKNYRSALQPIFEKFGVSSKEGVRKLANIEFGDPKNIKTASSLIDDISKTDLDGLSLRKLSDKIESSKYKIATSDERLSFNAFLNELSSGLKNAIRSSTNKLDEANAAFSSDMQLAETVQNIFGKVNFKNLPEVVKASQKLETVFSQKGLAPKVVDDFLEKIGINSKNFKTSEAVRQISDKVSGSNAKGLTFGELTQGITSSVVTPQMVRDISIYTGIAKEKLIPLLNEMKTPARNAVIEALVQSSGGGSGRIPLLR